MVEGKVFQGKIKFFSEHKGYGFIIPSHGGKDLLFNHRSMKKPKLAKTLQKEQKVSYTIEDYKGKTAVRNLEIISEELPKELSDESS